jgi:PKD repeat protein
MTAVDGAFDETIEAVAATIDTAGLSLDRHIIFVRGQDSDGNWGPVSAVFMNPGVAPTVEFTDTAPVLLGRPVDFFNLTTGAPPLEFHWDFGDNQGVSIERDPSYTFASSGSFTVTLTATNPVGVDRASHPVVVHSHGFFLPFVTKLLIP